MTVNGPHPLAAALRAMAHAARHSAATQLLGQKEHDLRLDLAQAWEARAAAVETQRESP